jgi:acetyl esterase/lipase
MRNPHDRNAQSDFPHHRRAATIPAMTGTKEVRRVADLVLRAAGGPVAVRVRWPFEGDIGATPPLFVLLGDTPRSGRARTDDDRLAHALCGRLGAVVLCVPWATRDAGGRRSALARAEAALHWSADHADELDADPERLVLGGRGAGAAAASALARRASERGWPRLGRPVLLVDEQLGVRA